MNREFARHPGPTEPGAWASGYGVEFETGQDCWIRRDPQFRKVFTVQVEGHGFPYIARELVERRRLSHNRKVQAFGHVLLLASKDTDLDNALQDTPLSHSTG